MAPKRKASKKVASKGGHKGAASRRRTAPTPIDDRPAKSMAAGRTGTGRTPID